MIALAAPGVSFATQGRSGIAAVGGTNHHRCRASMTSQMMPLTIVMDEKKMK